MEENDLFNTETIEDIAETNVFTEPTHSINPIVYALMGLGKSLLGLLRCVELNALLKTSLSSSKSKFSIFS